MLYYIVNHGLRTPNEGINQRNLKFWADVADKICFCCIYKFWIGIWFLAMQWRRFLRRVSLVRVRKHGVRIPDPEVKRKICPFSISFQILHKRLHIALRSNHPGFYLKKILGPTSCFIHLYHQSVFIKYTLSFTACIINCSFIRMQIEWAEIPQSLSRLQEAQIFFMQGRR